MSLLQIGHPSAQTIIVLERSYSAIVATSDSDIWQGEWRTVIEQMDWLVGGVALVGVVGLRRGSMREITTNQLWNRVCCKASRRSCTEMRECPHTYCERVGGRPLGGGRGRAVGAEVSANPKRETSSRVRCPCACPLVLKARESILTRFEHVWEVVKCWLVVG